MRVLKEALEARRVAHGLGSALPCRQQRWCDPIYLKAIYDVHDYALRHALSARGHVCSVR